MTGMYQSRVIPSQGTINLGARGPRTFVRRHIVSGCPVIPPKNSEARGMRDRMEEKILQSREKKPGSFSNSCTVVLFSLLLTARGTRSNTYSPYLLCFRFLSIVYFATGHPDLDLHHFGHLTLDQGKGEPIRSPNSIKEEELLNFAASVHSFVLIRPESAQKKRRISNFYGFVAYF